VQLHETLQQFRRRPLVATIDSESDGHLEYLPCSVASDIR
jgi:hypothetical protein